MKQTNKQSSTNNPHNWCTDGTEQNQIPVQNCKAYIPCSFYTDTDFTHPSELLSFRAPSVRLIDLASASTHPHRQGYVLHTFLAQRQNRSPLHDLINQLQVVGSSSCPLPPSALVCQAGQSDGLPVHQFLRRCQAPRNLECVSWLPHRNAGLFSTVSPSTQTCLLHRTSPQFCVMHWKRRNVRGLSHL